MKNRNNLFLGGLLIVLGGVALGLVNDWFTWDVTMRQIAKFWPILIILAGLAVLLDDKRNFMNATSVLLVALAIPFGIYNCTSNTFDHVEDRITQKGFDFDVDINDEDNSFTYEEGDSSTTTNNSYRVENRPEVKSVKLNVSGGAAQFLLGEAGSGDVFLADTKTAGISKFSLTESLSGSEQKIDFRMKGEKKVKINKKGIDRKVTFMLNTAPTWDIDMEVGAGDVKYDFSNFKVEKFKLESGASNVNLKFGDLLSESKVALESGVTNINIDVPQSVGCEIKIDGALNARNFTGFTKVKNGLYRTEGFDSASKKIYIDMDSGMSNIEVNRY